MEELNLDKFSPKEAELKTLAKEAEGLVIKNVDDTAGYKLVHEKRMSLKATRVEITKQGKLLRDGALQFQKAVIQREKELIAIIEPIEESLEAKEKAIDEEKARIKRQADLPIRIEKLKLTECEYNEADILGMDDAQFNEFLMTKTNEYVARKQEAVRLEQEERERKLKEEQEKLEADRKKLEEDQRLEAAKKQAEKEAQEKAAKDAKLAKQKAEQDKKDAIEAEKLKAKKEKEKIIADQKAKDDARIAAEIEAKEKADKAAKDAKEAEEARIRLEEREQKRLEKLKKYQKFLLDNGVNEKTKADFKLTKNETEVTIWKKIAVFEI